MVDVSKNRQKYLVGNYLKSLRKKAQVHLTAHKNLTYNENPTHVGSLLLVL